MRIEQPLASRYKNHCHDCTYENTASKNKRTIEDFRVAPSPHPEGNYQLQRTREPLKISGEGSNTAPRTLIRLQRTREPLKISGRWVTLAYPTQGRFKEQENH